MAEVGCVNNINDLKKAANLLREGKLIAFPTETVYGLGGDATNPNALTAIYKTKVRPIFNPLIIHLADASAVEKYAIWNRLARKLAEEFWPGPLTLVLPRCDGCIISDIASAGLNSVALRVPSEPSTLTLLKQVDRPVAAPSANRSGGVSPTTVAHVLSDLGEVIPFILDGGSCAIGLESTVLGFIENRPVLLRPGGITVEKIKSVLGTLEMGIDTPLASSAPGHLLSHYAPAKELRLNAREPILNEIYLGFGPSYLGKHNLSQNGNLDEAAAALFKKLRELDNEPGKGIAVAPIPNWGLGLAINDRLKRAAAPRI